jgi:hypothetical protein
MNNPSLLEALIGNQTSVRKRGHASVRLDVVDTFSLQQQPQRCLGPGTTATIAAAAAAAAWHESQFRNERRTKPTAFATTVLLRSNIHNRFCFVENARLEVLLCSFS